jgi:hypothetical protein
MITDVRYTDIGGRRHEIKKLISENNYKTIDIGGSMDYWSYPESKYVADLIPVERFEPEGTTFFKIELGRRESYKELFDYVEKNGKFDFSVCSHTLEDVFNPLDVIELLEKISHKGFIAVPSKFNEFSRLYNNDYYGNAHHKQILDYNGDKLVIYPKFPFIERRTDKVKEIAEMNRGFELNFLWENKIENKIFAENEIIKSDDGLISKFFDEIKVTI